MLPSDPESTRNRSFLLFDVLRSCKSEITRRVDLNPDHHTCPLLLAPDELHFVGSRHVVESELLVAVCLHLQSRPSAHMGEDRKLSCIDRPIHPEAVAYAIRQIQGRSNLVP